MDTNVAKRLEDFRKSVTTTGEYIVFHNFPNKWHTDSPVHRELHQLIESTTTSASPFHLSHATKATELTVYPAPGHSSFPDDPHTKKRKRTVDSTAEAVETTSNGTHQGRHPSLVLANKHISNLHQAMKKECDEFVDMVDKVKLWVNLTMPKLEDVDNFGVQVQEEVLTELHRAYESAYNLRDTPRQDYLNRAKICSKIIKYPHIEDYIFALKEHDERQLYMIRQCLFDIRNMYAVLTDLIHKNISKIRAPKGNNSVGL